MKTARKIFLALLAIIFITLLFVPAIKKDDRKSRIIATNFVAYDFARAITGSDNSISLLIKPGTELHDFEPTPDDIISIQQADAIIYNGGESETWLEDILDDLPDNVKKIRMFDYVELLEESDTNIINADEDEGDDSEKDKIEYDEHIWTSPKNAIKIIRGVAKALGLSEPTDYIARLASIDQQFDSLPKQTLIFADRFPFYYFTHDYGYNYYAAYPGCAEHTEANPKTIAKLIEYVKKSHVKTIYTIELSDQKIAKTIASATGASIQTFHSAHNISKEDFENGVTYADLLEQNLAILKENQ